jgi:hypothetical protein
MNANTVDLRAAFPDMKGPSFRNLRYMKFFVEHCPARQFGQQSAAQINALPNLKESVGIRFSPPKAQLAGVLSGQKNTQGGLTGLASIWVNF